MLSSGLPPVLLVLSVLELSWSLSDEEKKIILDEHNRYRSQVDPPARAMMKMSWDTDLEIKAQAFAEKCIWGRNGDWNGINIIAVDSTQDVKLAIEKWNEERKFYNLATFMCDRRQMCSRYTQVVWAKTSRIGCGAHFCEKIDRIKIEKHLLVCSYYPTGNIRGQKPYLEGPSCSSCPTVCEDKLCENMNGNGNGNRNRNGNGNRNRNGTSVERPRAGAPSTCLALSLFLLPSATLVGLLL